MVKHAERRGLFLAFQAVENGPGLALLRCRAGRITDPQGINVFGCGYLLAQRGAGDGDLALPMPPFHRLFGGQRRQHADHDDGVFLEESAPAMDGFGLVNLH